MSNVKVKVKKVHLNKADIKAQDCVFRSLCYKNYQGKYLIHPVSQESMRDLIRQNAVDPRMFQVIENVGSSEFQNTEYGKARYDMYRMIHDHDMFNRQYPAHVLRDIMSGDLGDAFWIRRIPFYPADQIEAFYNCAVWNVGKTRAFLKNSLTSETQECNPLMFKLSSYLFSQYDAPLVIPEDKKKEERAKRLEVLKSSGFITLLKNYNYFTHIRIKEDYASYWIQLLRGDDLVTNTEEIMLQVS